MELSAIIFMILFTSLILVTMGITIPMVAFDKKPKKNKENTKG